MINHQIDEITQRIETLARTGKHDRCKALQDFSSRLKFLNRRFEEFSGEEKDAAFDVMYRELEATLIVFETLASRRLPGKPKQTDLNSPYRSN